MGAPAKIDTSKRTDSKASTDTKASTASQFIDEEDPLSPTKVRVGNARRPSKEYTPKELESGCGTMQFSKRNSTGLNQQAVDEDGLRSIYKTSSLSTVMFSPR